MGHVIKLDNEPYTVIGVLPLEAVFPDPAEIWVPLQADPDPQKGTGWYLNGVGRLKHGVSAQQAEADLLRVHKSVSVHAKKSMRSRRPSLRRCATAISATSEP